MTDREKIELYIGLMAEEIQDKFDSGLINEKVYEYSMNIVDGYLDILHKSLNMNMDKASTRH